MLPAQTATMEQLDTMLRALAGLPPTDRGNFYLPNGTRPIQVLFDTDGDGDTTGMILSVPYDLATRHRGSGDAPVRAARPLEIVLCRETTADVHAKQRGVSIEWQAGHPEFDRQVYVSTPTDDTHVLAQVIGQPVRDAVLELLALGIERVSIDVEGRVEAYVTARALKPDGNPKRACQVLTAFDRISASLPRLVHSGESRAPHPLKALTWLLGAIGVVGWSTNVGYFGAVTFVTIQLVSPTGDHDIPAWPVLTALAIGIVLGMVGAKAYGAILTDRLRGRSDAHSLVGRAQIAGFGGLSVLTFTAAYVILLTFAL